MGLQINTNVTALDALRNLTNTSGAVSSSIQKLSSGLRINNAADDPAGLIISEGLRAQIDGLNQAISNSQDASNVIKTAEGGLTEVNALLRNIRQLAVHAANTGVNDSVAVQADQAQITSAISSIDRIATQTQFGTKKLLDGSSGTSSSIANSSLISNVSIGNSFTAGGTTYTTASGNITLTAVTKAVRATQVGTNANYAGGLTDNITYASTIVINGQTVNATTADTVQSLLNKINNLTSTTGVTATFDSTAKQFSLQTVAYGTSAGFNISEVAANGVNAALGIGAAGAGGSISNSTASTVGVNGSITVQLTTTAGAQSDTYTGGTGADGLQFTDATGNTVHLTEQGNTLTGSTTPALPVQIGELSAASVQFQIGGNAGQTTQVNLGNIKSTVLGIGSAAVGTANLGAVNVSTASGANDAILVADAAITQVSQLRANLGAFQKNTLNSTIQYLGVGVENLSASESQIRDTNVASEVVNLTKNQIIQQAGTSVLAQANSQPQQILKLLQ